MIGKGYLAYLDIVKNVSSDTPTLDLVLVVREFPNAFLGDLPDMPPDRDIDFDIDLAPDTQPISIPSYCMAPTKLKELKEQEDHEKHLRMVLLILREKKLYAKFSKRSGFYAIHYDASNVGLGCVLMQDGKVIVYASHHSKSYEKNHLVRNLELAVIKDLNLRQRKWLKLLKDYNITILCHPGKANVVAYALGRNMESIGSLTFIPTEERPLAMDVQALGNKLVRLDIDEPSRVLACVVLQPSLFKHIKAH
uniref:Uncharacterized protein LOC104218205 n=1 Tax=Nicotiana sylvestris TaxID=4096 RepID=A0A1U7VX28_NICSY|nr:PREDICTED: uncharacterized protein LOC104218205 [Nicotiana sylvestris]